RRTSAVQRHGNVQQRRVLLRAEDVAVAGRAAGRQPIEGELDRQAGIVLHEVRNASVGDAVQGRHAGAREGAGALDRVVGGAVAEDDIEGDLVYAGILAADGLGEFAEFL